MSTITRRRFTSILLLAVALLAMLWPCCGCSCSDPRFTSQSQCVARAVWTCGTAPSRGTTTGGTSTGAQACSGDGDAYGATASEFQDCADVKAKGACDPNYSGTYGLSYYRRYNFKTGLCCKTCADAGGTTTGGTSTGDSTPSYVDQSPPPPPPPSHGGCKLSNSVSINDIDPLPCKKFVEGCSTTYTVLGLVGFVGAINIFGVLKVVVKGDCDCDCCRKCCIIDDRPKMLFKWTVVTLVVLVVFGIILQSIVASSGCTTTIAFSVFPPGCKIGSEFCILGDTYGHAYPMFIVLGTYWPFVLVPCVLCLSAREYRNMEPEDVSSELSERLTEDITENPPTFEEELNKARAEIGASSATEGGPTKPIKPIIKPIEASISLVDGGAASAQEAVVSVAPAIIASPASTTPIAAATSVPVATLADLEAQKQAAVARGDYMAAAEIKKQIDAAGAGCPTDAAAGSIYDNL